MSSEADSPKRYTVPILQALRKITRAAELYSKKLASEHSITGPQLVCLLTVEESQPITAAQLARAIHVSPSTLVGVLDRLEKKGLVARLRDSTDRRRLNITLTEAGRALAAAAPPPLQDKLTSRLSNLSELERAAISLALERVAKLMEEEVP